jgi:hypothetical protein
MAMMTRIHGLVPMLAIALGCATLEQGNVAAPDVVAASSSEGAGATRSESTLAPALPEVRRLSVTPRIVDLERGDRVEIRFALDTDAPAVVHIQDDGGRLVRSLDAVVKSGTERSASWDGTAEDGKPIAPGTYRYRILSKGAVPPSDASGREPDQEVLAQRFTFDAATGKIGFVLPQPARVRLRMGLRGLPVMRTYYAWEPLEGGRHEIEWDGWDSTRTFEIARHPNVSLGLFAKSIPDDAIIVKQGPPRTSDPCAEVCFSLSLPDATSAEGGVPVVSGDVATLRIALDERDYKSLVNVRFEVMVFLDTLYLFEDEDAPALFNYPLDTRALPPGRHLLTVNILGYDDRLGSRSLEFIKRDPLSTRRGAP